MRYLMTFSYDGSKYNGYQKQKNEVSIQEEIEKVLTKINSNMSVSISASGRTDRGVHAINQKAHFDMENNYDINRLRYSINSLLPSDIYVKKIELVENNFHARFDVKSKEYIYKINIGEYNPIEKDYVYQLNQKLNINMMKEAITYFIGKHDFRSFVKANVETDDFEREIFDAKISNDPVDDNIIIISFVGSGFMRYMVRNMVGFLIEVGENKRNSDDVKNVLDLKNRQEAGITAPACGLYLKDVFY